MNKKLLIQFGQKVRETRQKQGLSQEELAFKADVHRTYIGSQRAYPFLETTLLTVV